MTQTQSAWAMGLATYAGDRMLDAWFPEPHLGLDGAPTIGSHPPTSEVQGAQAGDLISGARADEALHVDLTGWAVPIYRGELSEELVSELNDDGGN